MCGIVLLAGNMNGSEGRLFDLMLEIDTIRGRHSTGMAVVGLTAKDINLYKEVIPGYEFVNRATHGNERRTTASLWMGHNRHATIGGHTIENAHPFENEKLIGVHNGSLEYSYHRLLEDSDEFGTDSECIFHNIAKNGLDWTLARLHGAYALVWYDKETHTLQFIKNNKRPLYYGFSSDGKQFVMSSEAKIFHLASEHSRNYMDIRHAKNLLWAVKDDHHYVLQLPNNFASAWKKDDDFLLCEKKEDIGKILPVYTPVNNGYYKWWEDNNKDYEETDNAYGYSTLFEKKREQRQEKKENVTGKTGTGHTNVEQQVVALWDSYSARSKKRHANFEYRQRILRAIPEKEEAYNMLLQRRNLEAEKLSQENLWDNSVQNTKRAIGYCQQLDYYDDIIDAYEKRHGMERIDDSEIIKLLPAPSDTEPKHIQSPDNFLDAPSGYLSMTNLKFKKFIRENACCFCSGQDVNWDGSDCVPLTSGDYVCPDCRHSELFNEYIDDGIVKLKVAN